MKLFEETLRVLTILFIMVSCDSVSSKKVQESADNNGNSTNNTYKITGFSEDVRLKEISGLVKSVRYPNNFWLHNDSGDSPIIYRVNESLDILQDVKIESAENIDWEDIAIGNYKGTSTLFIADIGDNFGVRNSITIYVVPEPGPNAKKAAFKKKVELFYEDGPRDAESLIFDSTTKELIIISKRDIPSRVYSIDLEDSNASTLRFQGVVNLPNSDNVKKKDLYLLTAADSDDNGAIILKNYLGVYYYAPDTQRSAVTKLLHEFPVKLKYYPELQGEAIALDAENNGFWVTSECADDGKAHVPQPMYFYEDFKTLLNDL